MFWFFLNFIGQVRTNFQITLKSSYSYPLPQFFPAYLFSIHQNSCTVNFSGKPRGGNKWTDKHRKRKQNLPRRNIIRHACHHYHRWCEGNYRSPKCQCTVGALSCKNSNKYGKNNGQSDRHGELLCISFVIHGWSNSGKKWSVKQVTTKKIK